MDIINELQMNSTQLVDNTLIKNIHDFLQTGDQKVKYCPDKDIVLLLGNTGSGKSTLTYYISGNAHSLLSQEVGEETGQFIIVDKEKKISGNSTIVSQTIFPDLVENKETQTLYYDCPGFSDTRSAAHEIAATYFIKKVIDRARSVKLVFVVSHNAVSSGEDRQNFLLMLQHAADFIKQIEKYKNGIALVVTKIENRYIGGKIVQDKKVINAIGGFLKQAKIDVDRNPGMIISHGNSTDNREKVLSLLDIFQNKGENGEYTRIGIFRKPDAPGLISDIELLKNGKISLENLINKNIQYVVAGDDDFGYTVSAKSKVHISSLAEEINKTIVTELINLGKEVENYCVGEEEKTSDLEFLNFIFQKLEESFSKIQTDAIADSITPEMLINEIVKYLINFKINVADHHSKAIQREGDYINFLNLVSNGSIKSHKSSRLVPGLSKLTDYLKDTHSFYGLLEAMYQRLSQYEIQKIRNQYNPVQVKELNSFYESPIYKKVENNIKQYKDIRKIKLNEPKLKLFNRVLEQTLTFQLETTIAEIDKVVIKGVNVKLSDLDELWINKNFKFIEIYALNKVFIDTTLDLTGREMQMSIIAPVWEVVGSQSIILDGKPADEHYQKKAKSGKNYGESGESGLPGEPGGPAGNFIGIGESYFNAENLHISANGGNGGRGQDGGDGYEGYDGAHCPNKDCAADADLLITIFYNKGDAEYKGGKGGDGGDGAVGGYGGHRGSIFLHKVGKESGAVPAKLNAIDGHLGANGNGGRGGRGGRYFTHKVRNYVIFVQQESFEPMDKWAKDGAWGNDIGNSHLRQPTWRLTKLLNPSNVKSEYKNYLQSNMNNNLQEILLKRFLGEIDNTLHRKRRNARGDPKPGEEMRNIRKRDQSVIQTHKYDRYVEEGTGENYLDVHRHFISSTDVNKPLFSDVFLETENMKQTPSVDIFPVPQRIEHIETEKHVNINNQYPSINLHGNLLLSEMIMKKLLRKDISSNHDPQGGFEEGMSYAHDLAYRHYRKH